MFGPKPPIARQHCRHYSYETGLAGGPRCAVGVDLSAPGSFRCCVPDGTGCPKRQEWTDPERATWKRWQEAGTARMAAAIAALPSLGPRQSVVVDCPNCSGRLRYDRTVRRAYAQCATEHCVRFEAALRDGPWPAPK